MVFRGTTLTLPRVNITHLVQYNKGESELDSVQCGIPHGSMLGPLLLVISSNDLRQQLDILRSRQVHISSTLQQL